ncbi:hypothetical protein PBY51_006687 [Eleginops maclovinus]|uniref:Uncharacterized protein n=1 Tax=Eleginops maclovinus TaxID=56733 RepID=A0AAN8AF32_ELEMC|nr:hypothetical protein PBY51_006687 [Eleginops maclovinus]
MADRRSARTPPARVIYDQQLLLQPMTRTAGCQMWSPCKQKLIWQPNISRRLDGEGVGVRRRGDQVGERWTGKMDGRKGKKRNERKQMIVSKDGEIVLKKKTAQHQIKLDTCEGEVLTQKKV